jgi:hypothetical protein
MNYLVSTICNGMTSTCKLMLAREIWGIHDDKCEYRSSGTWRQRVSWNLRKIRGRGFHLHSYSFHISARNTWPPTLVEHKNKHRSMTPTINNNNKKHHSSREFVKYRISFDYRIERWCGLNLVLITNVSMYSSLLFLNNLRVNGR